MVGRPARRGRRAAVVHGHGGEERGLPRLHAVRQQSLRPHAPARLAGRERAAGLARVRRGDAPRAASLVARASVGLRPRLSAPVGERGGAALAPARALVGRRSRVLRPGALPAATLGAAGVSRPRAAGGPRVGRTSRGRAGRAVRAHAPRAGARAVRAGRLRAHRGLRRLSALTGGRAVELRHRHAESDRSGSAGARRAVRGVDAALLLRCGHLRARRGGARGRGLAARRGAGCRGHPGRDDRLPAGGGGQRYDPVRAEPFRPPPGGGARPAAQAGGPCRARGRHRDQRLDPPGRAPPRPHRQRALREPGARRGAPRPARHLLGLAPIRAGLVGAGPPLPHLGGRPTRGPCPRSWSSCPPTTRGGLCA